MRNRVLLNLLPEGLAAVLDLVSLTSAWNQGTYLKPHLNLARCQADFHGDLFAFLSRGEFGLRRLVFQNMSKLRNSPFSTRYLGVVAVHASSEPECVSVAAALDHHAQMRALKIRCRDHEAKIGRRLDLTGLTTARARGQLRSRNDGKSGIVTVPCRVEQPEGGKGASRRLHAIRHGKLEVKAVEMGDIEPFHNDLGRCSPSVHYEQKVHLWRKVEKAEAATVMAVKRRAKIPAVVEVVQKDAARSYSGSQKRFDSDPRRRIDDRPPVYMTVMEEEVEPVVVKNACRDRCRTRSAKKCCRVVVFGHDMMGRRVRHGVHAGKTLLVDLPPACFLPILPCYFLKKTQ